ncbi:hypothetical protein FI667_g3516, partial [Globisporangium splendens]
MLSDTLTPTVMEPEWSSQRRQLEAVLRRIEHVDVERSKVTRDGICPYVIEVYAYETSKNRIPTNARRPEHREVSCNAIARVERRCSAFSDLRCHIYNHVFEAHEVTPCDFCQRVIDEIVWGDNKPTSAFTWMASEETRTRKLAKSVAALLKIVQCDYAESRVCSGQEKVHQELHSFLFTE